MEIEEFSRPAIIALSAFTLRLMENWRAALKVISPDPMDADADTVLIVVAVVAVGAEKFMRSGLERQLYSLRAPMPEGHLTRCNVRSLAAATGINRETVRRKVGRLEQLGVLEKESDDGWRVSAAIAQREEVLDLVRSQLAALDSLNEQLRVVRGRK